MAPMAQGFKPGLSAEVSDPQSLTTAHAAVDDEHAADDVRGLVRSWEDDRLRDFRRSAKRPALDLGGHGHHAGHRPAEMRLVDAT